MSWYDTIMNVNRQILNRIPVFVNSVRRQNMDLALRTSTFLSGGLAELMAQLERGKEKLAELGSDAGAEVFLPVLSSILDAQEQKDYIFAADLYEIQIAPYLQGLQELLIGQSGGVPELDWRELDFLEERAPKLAERIRKDEKLSDLAERACGLEYASTGELTMRFVSDSGSRYLHSNLNPYWEAEELADRWYHASCGHFCVYGLGLAHHIEALMRRDEAARIEVFEGSLAVLEAAVLSGRLRKLLESQQVEVIYDPHGEKLPERLAAFPEAELLIHYPSMIGTADPECKAYLENYFIQYQAVKNQLGWLEKNFRENVKLPFRGLTELLPLWKGKRVFIVAAGPSLDKNFLELKKKNDGDIILATGTVLRKLLKAGIRPDYVMLSDASARMISQRKGIEDNRIPLIFVSTACHAYVKAHEGTRYLACQEGFEPAVRLASLKGYPLIRTGGSVTIAALGAGLALKAGQIIFLGLDLAYTDHLRHAENTSGRQMYTTDGLTEAVDIFGNQIHTARNWNLFREKIEEIIADYPEVSFVDATEGGVKIAGTRIQTLQSLLEG